MAHARKNKDNLLFLKRKIKQLFNYEIEISLELRLLLSGKQKNFTGLYKKK